MILGHCSFENRIFRHQGMKFGTGASETVSHTIGALQVVADSWVDNREELVAALDARNDAHDAELFALAYQRWGEYCAARFLGDFAVAVWDTNRRRLVLIRSPFGVRPLNYCADRRGAAFAGRVVDLLGMPNVPRRLNEPMLAAYLQRPSEYFAPLAERTFWAGLYKVPPGCAVAIDAEDVRTIRWHRWEDAPEISFPRDSDYADAFRDRLEAAVARCLARSGRVGSHISGGIDCSTVAVLASRQLKARGDKLTAAYTWFCPPGAEYADGEDSYATAAAIAAAEGVPLHGQYLTAENIAALDLEDFTRYPTHMLTYERTTLEQAQGDGITVMLSGWGGDEAATFRRWAAWFSLLQQMRWMTARRLAREHADRRGRGMARDVAAWLWRGWRRGQAPVTMRGGVPRRGFVPLPFVAPEFNRQVIEFVMSSGGAMPHQEQGIRAFMSSLLGDGHITERVESWTEAGAAHGIVYRFPLLDRDLVEFCLGLPPEQFLLGGQIGSHYCRAMAGRIPESILAMVRKPSELQRVGRYLRHFDASIGLLQVRARDSVPPPVFDWIDYGALRKAVAKPLYARQPDELGRRYGFVQRQAARISLLLPQWLAASESGARMAVSRNDASP